MPTLPNMSLVLPTLGGDSGSWDDKLNAALTLVDAHDHTSGKGISIKTAAISIDADLSFGGYGATALGKAAFSAVTALAAGSKTLFVSSADNELYWRTNGGTNVKLTSGSTINVSLVGGIVGDYTSVGAEVAYDDANDRYTFKQEGTKPWARIASGPVRIYEYNTTETVYVELAVAAALASSYTLTLPAALPGAAALVQVSSAGAVSFSNTTTQSITAADFRYTGEQTIQIPAASAEVVASGGPVYQAAAWNSNASAGQLWYPIPTVVGQVIKSWLLFVNKTSNATKTLTATLVKITSSTRASTTVGSSQTTAANNPGDTTMGQNGLTETVAADTSYALVVSSNSAAADLYGDLQVNTTKP